MFKWDSNIKKLMGTCEDSREIQRNVLTSLLKSVPKLKKPVKYIGLNTEGDPDMLISFLPPAEAMQVVQKYQNKKGKMLNTCITSMMSVCGGVAVNTYVNKKICVSFGCDDSRKYADIGRETLIVGIPKNMFNVILN